MKFKLICLISIIYGCNVFAQSDSLQKFIFIPHARSDDRVNQSVLPGIEAIDYSDYDVIMLGGDVTWSASTDSTSLAYCDNLFDLGSPNTLWSFGNHDVSSGHRSLIKEFTGRESYYAHSRDGVTFIVLDTELNTNSNSSTFIKDDQLQMVKNVCDTISESSYLILLHHRFMWMANNADLDSLLSDAIAASSRSLDTTNFYEDIYPLLQKVKARGIQVLVFGGDRSDLNIVYSPEDSITFYAARLSEDFPEDVINVIVINYNPFTKELTTDFVLVSDLITVIEKEPSYMPQNSVLYQNYPNPFNPTTTISFTLSSQLYVSIKIYDLLGREIVTLISGELSAGNHSLVWNAKSLPTGVYYYRIHTEKYDETKKLILMR